MAVNRACHIAGCDDPLLYAMVAENGLRVGYLCQAHKEEWYDARAEHHTKLERINQKGGTDAMGPSGQARGAQSYGHATRGGSARADARARRDHGDTMERGRSGGAADQSAQPTSSNRQADAPTKAPTLGELIVSQATAGAVGLPGLTPEVSAVLESAVDPELVEIRPDGIVYLPWTEYATILDRAFGQGQWSHVPDGRPMLQDGFVIWGFALFIRGSFVSFSLGEHPDPKNQKMSLANRAEAAKSDALVKNCKSLGVFRDLWRPAWIAEWKEEFAVQVNARQYQWSSRAQHLWRRKDRHPFFEEIDNKSTGETEWSKAPRFQDEANAHLEAIRTETDRGPRPYDFDKRPANIYPDGED